MSGAGVPLGRKEAERDRVAVEAEQICPACHQALWLSFFFDGFGYSDKTGPKTNIVKLFQAAYDDPEKGKGLSLSTTQAWAPTSTQRRQRWPAPWLAAQFPM